MLRLVQICKGGRFSRALQSVSAVLREFSSPTNALLQDYWEDRNEVKYRKEIDIHKLFKICTKLQPAKCLHSHLIMSKAIQDVFLSVKLVNLYCYLGNLVLARSVFDHIQNRDVYAWNAMISGYVRAGCSSEAVRCFSLFMLTSGLKPDYRTFPSVLKACGNVLDGMKIHCSALKLGFIWDVFVAASLVHLYCRNGPVTNARRLFDEMPIRDMGSWNAMISGYCQSGNAKEALALSKALKVMDAVTIVSLLAACTEAGELVRGVTIHLYSIKHGLDSELFVSNKLIDLYAESGDLNGCQKIFDGMITRDLISWNSIIKAYELNEQPFKAVRLFHEMRLNRVQPDCLTLISLASILAQLGDVQGGKSVQGFALRKGWFLEDITVRNAVLDMYGKLGLVDSARAVFSWLPNKDVITWNTMISGYAQNGFASEAIEMYNEMKEGSGDITANQGTWVSVLPACSQTGALRQGMKIHGRLFKNGLYSDVFIGTSLSDMYGKCGQLDDALSVFYQIPRVSSVPWNTLIACHGLHGHGEKAMKLFREMLEEQVKPDHITFISLLSACSHSGLVDEGRWCFEMMQTDYGVTPSLKHYGCMVDLFGRAGELETAYDFIKTMPIQPDTSIWGALLGACRVHGNVDLGKIASRHLFEVDPEHVGYHVLLSNMYASAGKWEGVDEIRSKGLRKTPGWSSMEVNNKVEVFYTGNQTNHPMYEEIFRELTSLHAKSKMIGYVPDYNFVLQDVEDDEKEHILMGHSERLAIAFGLIATHPKTTIRIFKNLRVCGDCHSVTKFISKITDREVVVRDSNRFHHFKDGVCSCGDYW